MNNWGSKQTLICTIQAAPSLRAAVCCLQSRERFQSLHHSHNISSRAQRSSNHSHSHSISSPLPQQRSAKYRAQRSYSRSHSHGISSPLPQRNGHPCTEHGGAPIAHSFTQYKQPLASAVCQSCTVHREVPVAHSFVRHKQPLASEQ